MGGTLLSDYEDARSLADLNLLPWPIVLDGGNLIYVEFEDGRWAYAETADFEGQLVPTELHTSQGYNERYRVISRDDVPSPRNQMFGDLCIGVESTTDWGDEKRMLELNNGCGLSFCEWAFELLGKPLARISVE